MTATDDFDIEIGQKKTPKYLVPDDESIDEAVTPATEQITDENLGEDFESTRWLPPSIEVAMEFKRETIFRLM